jgi:hypothetical protein
MKVVQVKTYRFTCDYCGKIEFVHDVDDFILPEQWTKVETKWAPTDYLCPKCSENNKDGKR